MAPVPVHKSIAAALDGEAFGGSPGEGLRVPAGHVDAGVDAQLEAAERDPAGDPGDGLPCQASGHQRVEQRTVAGRPAEEVLGLLVGGDEPGLPEEVGQRVEIVGGGHDR